jgi:hypothetical protein
MEEELKALFLSTGQKGEIENEGKDIQTEKDRAERSQFEKVVKRNRKKRDKKDLKRPHPTDLPPMSIPYPLLPLLSKSLGTMGTVIDNKEPKGTLRDPKLTSKDFNLTFTYPKVTPNETPKGAPIAQKVFISSKLEKEKRPKQSRTSTSTSIARLNSNSSSSSNPNHTPSVVSNPSDFNYHDFDRIAELSLRDRGNWDKPNPNTNTDLKLAVSVPSVTLNASTTKTSNKSQGQLTSVVKSESLAQLSYDSIDDDLLSDNDSITLNTTN